MRRLFTDGSSRGNGKKGHRAHVAVYDESRRQIVVDEAVGERTNNEAEIIAVLRALDYALAQGMTGDVCIVTDSQLTCNQILGRWKVKAPHLRPMVADCQRKLKEANAEIAWVPREENHAGRYIEARLNPADHAPTSLAPAAEVVTSLPELAATAAPAPQPRPSYRPSPPSLRRTVPYGRFPLED